MTDWVGLALDVEAWDRAPFADAVAEQERAGITFRSLAELGDHDADHRRLFELNRTCSADIPGRGPFHTYDEYRALRIEVDGFDPAGVVLALDGDEWVGMASASDHPERGYAFNEMTGVLRSHRRRGIALAAKVLVIEHVQALGRPVLYTIHQAANRPPIELNRKLGYVDAELPTA